MLIRRFVTSRDGGVAPMLALAALPLFGFVGAAIDFSRAAAVRTTMQSALDAAALAAAKDAEQMTSADLSSKATAYFNSVYSGPGNVEVTASMSQTSTGKSLALTASGAVQTQFMGVLGFNTLATKARTGAISDSDGLGCVLALNETASGAMTGQGNTNVVLNGCSLYDNSSNSTALVVGGSARLTAHSVDVVGGVSGASQITTMHGIRTGGAVLKDPYSDKSYPAFYGCTERNYTAKDTETINPGVYCGGITVNANGNLTLNPGIYYLDGGTLTVNGGSIVAGNAVTLVFTSKNVSEWATARINGNAIVQLIAPKSGPTAGIVLFGDRAMPQGTAFKLNGGSQQYFGGAIYLPVAAVDYVGGASTSTSCTQLIGDTIYFSGNSAFAINCSNAATRPFSKLNVRLSS
jgi:Flp pilus assembly protein TadG